MQEVPHSVRGCTLRSGVHLVSWARHSQRAQGEKERLVILDRFLWMSLECWWHQSNSRILIIAFTFWHTCKNDRCFSGTSDMNMIWLVSLIPAPPKDHMQNSVQSLGCMHTAWACNSVSCALHEHSPDSQSVPTSNLWLQYAIHSRLGFHAASDQNWRWEWFGNEAGYNLSTYLIASGVIAIATEWQTSLYEVWILLCCLGNTHSILTVCWLL